MQIIDIFFKYRLHIPFLIFSMCLLSFFPEISIDVVAVSVCFSCLGAFIYLFNKATDAQEDAVNVAGLPVDKKWHRRVKLSALGALILPFPFLLQWPNLLFLYVVLAGVGYLYSVPLRFLGFARRLKDFLFIKNSVSAACWGAGAALVPALYAGQALDLIVFLTALNYFVFIFAVEVVWDIRDIDGDREAGIKTLPNTLGVLPSKIICLTPIVFMFRWRLMNVDIHPIYLTAYCLTIVSIMFVQKNSHPYVFQNLIVIWILANSLFLGMYYL